MHFPPPLPLSPSLPLSFALDIIAGMLCLQQGRLQWSYSIADMRSELQWQLPPFSPPLPLAAAISHISEGCCQADEELTHVATLSFIIFQHFFNVFFFVFHTFSLCGFQGLSCCCVCVSGGFSVVERLEAWAEYCCPTLPRPLYSRKANVASRAGGGGGGGGGDRRH